MAHYDDDLIFANPTLTRAMRAGECVRTVFVTAGDAGRGLDYANHRETGIMRAYNVMRGEKLMWDEHSTTLNTGLHVTTMTPKGTTNVSVTFVRLPDGNLQGQGFGSTGDESLAKLYDGSLAALHQIDSGASVSLEQLVGSIAELINTYRPTTIITLVPSTSTYSQDDHSDHSTVGDIVRTTAKNAGVPTDAMRYARGYNSGGLPANVSGEDLNIKIDAFIIYAKMDAVSQCATRQACLDLRPFGLSLEREYLLTEGEL